MNDDLRIKLLAAADLMLAIILVATAWSLLHCEERVRAIEQRLNFYDSMLTTNGVEQFEAGVRYGLIAKSLNPSEDSIPKLTEAAKAWHWRIKLGLTNLVITNMVISNVVVRQPSAGPRAVDFGK